MNKVEIMTLKVEIDTQNQNYEIQVEIMTLKVEVEIIYFLSYIIVFLI